MYIYHKSMTENKEEIEKNLLALRRRRASQSNYQERINAEKPEGWKCPSCDKVYAWNTSLRRHIKSVHNKPIVELIAECGFTSLDDFTTDDCTQLITLITRSGRHLREKDLIPAMNVVKILQSRAASCGNS